MLLDWIPIDDIVIDVKTVEEFVYKYRLPSSYKSRGKEYEKAILKSHKAELEADGYTVISKHSSVTGSIVYFVAGLTVENMYFQGDK